MPPPKKYTREYFMERTSLLAQQIQESLPTSNELEKQAFQDACATLQQARLAKESAENLLQELKKKAKQGEKNQDEIAEATATLEACKEAFAAAGVTMTDTAAALLEHWDIESCVDLQSIMECTIVLQSHPKLLGRWIHANLEEREKLMDKFFADVEWMKQFIMWGGATNGNYGPALELHIQLMDELASQRPDCPELYRKLALATALEHATPITIFRTDEKGREGGKQYVDPVKRFWHYIHAYENKELDPIFENLSVWELRMVVDSDATDEDLQWGRDYLKAYRPDQIESDQGWTFKYVWTVRTDINYHRPYHVFDDYKGLLSAGGMCGPRAWMGRFICKAWGCPTWGVRQPGHAALTRWTPDGWVPVLGGGFVVSYWKDNRPVDGNREGPDFEEETLARSETEPSMYYDLVTVIDCVAESLGEKIQHHINPDTFWRSLALGQRRLLANQKVEPEKQPAKAGMNLQQRMAKLIAESQIQINPNGSVIIPAASFVEPKKINHNLVLVTESYLGGSQLHIEGEGTVTYQLPDSVQGTFSVEAKIVNVHRDQVPLVLSISSSSSADEVHSTLPIQYTIGEWQSTEKTEVVVPPGAKIRVWREKAAHGLTIKEFTLVPV